MNRYDVKEHPVTEAPEPAAVRPDRPLALRALPWLVPAGAVVAGLTATHTPIQHTALYAAYLAFGVTLPGTLVHRALRGSRGNLVEDVGLGAATGLLVMLAGWALAAATGLQSLLIGWPLLIIAVFAAVPGLRPFWRIPADRRDPAPLHYSWLLAAGLTGLVLYSFPFWSRTPLPPATAEYPGDLLYHLGLIHEMTRSMPFQVPQMTGDTLRYHYLSDADMAIASMITRIPAAEVLFRFWVVPIQAVTVLVVAALTRRLTGRWWAAALAGAIALVAVPLTFGAPVPTFGGSAISLVSPSHTYALALVALLLTLAVDAVDGRPLGRAWFLVLPLAVACAGAKSSALPPVVAGLALATVVVAVTRRGRRHLAVVAGFLGLTAVAMAVGTKIFAGGGAGTLALQPFAVLYWSRPYRQTIGGEDVIDGHLALPAGVEHATAAGLLFLAGLVLWWILAQAPRLLGLLTVATRPTRTEPAAWLLGGVTVAATGGVWLLWHPSASQVYFFLGMAPFAVALTVWLMAGRATGRHTLLTVAGGLAAGFLWQALGPVSASPADHTIGAWNAALWLPVLRTAAVALVVVAAGLLACRAVTHRWAWRAIPVALIAAVLGGGVAAGLEPPARSLHQALTRPAGKISPEQAVYADEARAALWLGANSGADDVIATNVHCRPLNPAKVCDARAFWVTGLSGRRALIESWGYTDQAVAEDGVNGVRYTMQPPPYAERFAVNQRVFASADPADVARLRDEYQVRWLFADSRAPGGATPGLARVARLRYTAGPVTVYELR